MSIERKIVWAPRALKQFNAAIAYIRRDSYQNADTIKEKFLSRISKLTDVRVTHRKDTYKINNNGCFHYFVLLNYRVSYYKDATTIIIVRIRHVKRKPLFFK